MKKLLLTLLLAPMLSFGQTHVTVYTSFGNFTLIMEDTLSPITAGNFLDLVDDEYYDEVIFHRVWDGFMVQGGDPTGTGSGNPGYFIQDEFIPGLSNVQGTVAMANIARTPNSGGSQFFINLVDNTGLDWDKPPSDSKHPVFGHVVENFDVVQQIALVPVNAADKRPLEDVIMDSVRVTPILSIEDLSTQVSLQVFPNPITSESKLKVQMDRAQKVDLKLFDLQGRLQSEVHFEQAPASFEFHLAKLMDALPQNLYIIEMRSEDGFVWREKLLLD